MTKTTEAEVANPSASSAAQVPIWTVKTKVVRTGYHLRMPQLINFHELDKFLDVIALQEDTAPVESIDCSESNIFSTSLVRISRFLELYDKVKIIDFSNQDLTHDQEQQRSLDGITALADALTHRLQHNKTLETLVLSNTKLSPEAALEIAKMLERNYSLKELFVDRNPIGPHGVERLIEALFTNKTLTTLDLSETPVTEESLKLLAQVLGVNLNPNAPSSILSYCWAAISSKPTNETLTTLFLPENIIGNKECKKIIDEINKQRPNLLCYRPSSSFSPSPSLANRRLSAIITHFTSQLNNITDLNESMAATPITLVTPAYEQLIKTMKYGGLVVGGLIGGALFLRKISP